MSHRRTKRLRAAFIAEHGRAPRKAEWSDGDVLVQDPRTGKYVPSPRIVIVQDELRQYRRQDAS